MNDKRLGGKFIQLRRLLPQYNHNTTQWIRIQVDLNANTMQMKLNTHKNTNRNAKANVLYGVTLCITTHLM